MRCSTQWPRRSRRQEKRRDRRLLSGFRSRKGPLMAEYWRDTFADLGLGSLVAEVEEVAAQWRTVPPSPWRDEVQRPPVGGAHERSLAEEFARHFESYGALPPQALAEQMLLTARAND